jgi:hypothetical protein
MAIFFFRGNIINKKSGRSATGAAAYRTGEVLRSAAYRSGEKLQDGEIIHDYRAKSGVVYSEIMLPENAPPEYADRQTLWNAVDEIEKRKDAQLAREIIVALPREFELDTQVELLRVYIEVNFVDKGMIADFSIHDKGDGNPHAHIMLSTRHVTPKGFGKKNRDWNRRELIMEWRESWADINNYVLEGLGFEDRIDHRSYKEQGIDREPMIHLGHEAAAMEKRGIKTAKGDYNRAVQERNAAREAALEVSEGEGESVALKKQREKAKPEKRAENRQPTKAQLAALLKERSKEREIEKVVRRMRESENNRRDEGESPPVGALQKQGRTRGEIEALQELVQCMRTQNAEDMVREMHERHQIAEDRQETMENYIVLDKRRDGLREEISKENQELPHMDYVVGHQQILQDNITKWQSTRQNLGWRDRKKRQELDKEIAEAEQYLKKSQEYFRNKYQIDSQDAQEVIARKEKEIKAKTVAIEKIEEQLKALELSYKTQKLLADLRPDREQIDKLLEKMNKPPESIHEKLKYQAIHHRLNTIGEEDFQKVIKNLPKNQAKPLIEKRQRTESQAKENITPDPPSHGRSR